MEKREKRIVSWLLALLMALSLLSPGALALEPEEPEEPENSPAGESLPGTDSGQSNEMLEPSGEAARRCTLHLTHTLRWKTPEGQGRFRQESAAIALTEEDFEDGVYPLMSLAYSHEALEAAPTPSSPEQLRLEDFWEDGKGGLEYAAEIRYTLLDGWSIRFPQDDGYVGSSFRGQYEGAFDQVEFVHAESITVTIHYLYSRTGGLAGMEAHAPDVIELTLDENGKADLVNWRVPHYEKENQDYHGHSHANLEGFRIVLNPAPLNEFLVDPPDPNATPEELAEALDRGDFNLSPEVETDSPEYQQAWDQARTTTVDGVTFTYIAPTENGGTAATTSDDSEKQYTLCAESLTKDLELTIYFRRDTGSYAVKYWKPAEGVSDPQQGNEADWQQIGETQTFPGRNGALTHAQPLDSDPPGYQMLPYSQETIKADGSTVVNIYYLPNAIRVIFDTDDIYIPRQLVKPGEAVDFDRINSDALNKAKAGYKFKYWQYRDKNGVLTDIPNNALTLTDEFLKNNATLENSAEAEGVKVLRLIPVWEEAPTPIRVTLWVEDLNGHDVAVTDTFHDFGTNPDRQIKRPGAESIVHQDPHRGGSFTNVGSFVMEDDFTTGESLVEGENLVSKIQTAVNDNLNNLFGAVTVTGNSGSQKVNNSDFYTQMDEFTILTEVVNPSNGKISEKVVNFPSEEVGASTTQTATAAANGTTQVYVYFTRKEYTLDFHYYFLPEEVNGSGSQNCSYICTETSPFQSTGWVWSKDNLKSVDDSKWSGILSTLAASFQNKIPMTTTISAKYGADLRNVWPGAEDASDAEVSTHFVLNDRLRLSWTPTAGLHKQLKVGNNFNIPGAYSTMSAAIVADWTDPNKANHLVAFWAGMPNNTYRYNYCYEIPDMSLDGAIAFQVFTKPLNPGFSNASKEEQTRRNTIYLVAIDNPVFKKWGFTDLLTADRLGLPKNQSLPQEVGDGSQYYVIRKYIHEGKEKYYAVSSQLVAMASRPINEMNPCARTYLTLVNSTPDHSTELTDGQSSRDQYLVDNNHELYETLDNPYDIYFYYTRESFTITYMSAGAKGAPQELGTITLPYGTTLDEDTYSFDLVYDALNGAYASPAKTGGWSLITKEGTTISAGLPVCPDRAENGKAVWNFAGWYLSPAGDREMDWGKPITGNLRLYARWKAPTYQVTFDWDGGSSINGEAAAPKEQHIPANRSFSSSGQIPRLTREGYTLGGWVITAKGKDKTPVNNDPFPFEEPVTQDLWVKAKWIPTDKAELSYTVHYYVKDTTTKVREDYVAPPASFLPGAIIWESPKAPTDPQYKDYIPLEQNKSVTLERGQANEITFYYTPPSEYPYTVRYVEWGKESNVVYTAPAQTTSVSIQVTPSAEHIQALNEQGYYLVDSEGNRAMNGATLAQLVRPGTEGQDTATFCVRTEIYTITYRNLEIMGEEAATLGNPSEYRTADEAQTLRNPTGSYQVDGQTISFRGWMMAEDTREVDGPRDFPEGTEVSEYVTIRSGSRGNLVFRAVWTPDVYGVYFRPGDHGSLAGTTSYGGILGNTVLGQVSGFSVPSVQPEGEYLFAGWKLESNGQIYTASDVRGIKLVDQDLYFTAQYRVPDPKPKPPEQPVIPDDPGPTPDPKPSEPDPEPDPEPETPPPLIQRPVDPDTGMVPYDPSVILDDLIPLAAPHLNITDHFAYIAGYPTGEVRPEGNITRGEVATIFFRLMLDEYRKENWATENSFPDVSAGDWYNNTISTCARAGILKGYEDGTFRPNDTITRAEFAAIAARFVSEDVPGYDYFTDMDGHWAQIDVARAVMAGWIKGEGRLFRPEDKLTRAEAATLVNRMINRFPDKEHLLPGMIRWPDNTEDKWYYEDIQEATNSHDYETEEFLFSEVWKALLINRDWAALEKEWADASDAPGGEVAPDLRPGTESGSTF